MEKHGNSKDTVLIQAFSYIATFLLGVLSPILILAGSIEGSDHQSQGHAWELQVYHHIWSVKMLIVFTTVAAEVEVVVGIPCLFLISNRSKGSSIRQSTVYSKWNMMDL